MYRGTYRSSLPELTDVYWRILALIMQREEGIGKSTVRIQLQHLLPGPGVGVGPVSTPPPGPVPAEGLAGLCMMELVVLSGCLLLPWRPSNRRIVDCLFAWPIKIEIPQRDAAQVTKPPVLRKQMGQWR